MSKCCIIKCGAEKDKYQPRFSSHRLPGNFEFGTVLYSNVFKGQCRKLPQNQQAFEVIVTALLAVCGAAKLERSYLPPLTTRFAGGSSGATFQRSSFPTGSYVNDNQGVVVDAVAPGTRTSGTEPSGLGASRTSYGSTDSKVGEAAFKGSLTGFRNFGLKRPTNIASGFGSIGGVKDNAEGSIHIAPTFGSIVATKSSDDYKSPASTLKFANEISKESYSYGFKTNNGISVGENGIAGDGIKANGEYSYKSNDGKIYSVSYTADKDGYKPQGNHLPTPPPIPKEIVKSLEDNAKDEAEGIIDDGSYDPQKYNTEGDYSSNNDDNKKNKLSTNEGATVSYSMPSSFQQGNAFNALSQASISSTDSLESKHHPGSTQGSSSFYSGITQALPTIPSTHSTQIKSQSSQFVLKLSDQFDQPISSQSQIGFSDNQVFNKKPIRLFDSVDQGQSKNSHHKPDLQLQHGTIYEYNKPFTNKETTASSNNLMSNKPSHTTTNTQGSHINSQYSKPFGVTTYGSPVQQNHGTVYEYPKPSGSISNQKETISPLGSQLSHRSSTSSNLEEHNPSLGNKPFTSSQTASFSQNNQYSQTNFDSFNGLQYDKNKPQFLNPLSFSKFNQNENTKKEFVEQVNKLGQTIFGTSQATSFGSTQTGFGTAFGSQIGQKPLTSTGTTGSAVSEVQSTSQQEQKPFGSQSSTGSLQAIQSSSYTSSKFGQNTGIKGQSSQQTTNFGEKPLGSSQTTSFGSTQTGFGTTFGSQFGQKPLTSTGTTGSAVFEVQSTSQQEQKPFGSQSATGSLQATQSSSYSSSKFGQNTGIKGQSSQQTTNFGQKPVGSSQTTSFGSTQNGFGTTFGSQFGQKPLTSSGDTDGTVSEGQSTSQQEQKPFGSQSSTGSLQATQLSSYTSSKFGQNTGIKGQTPQQSTNFGQKPVGSSQTTSFGSTQTGIGTTFGSQFGQKPLTSTGTTGSAVSEVQSTSQQEQKPIGSQSATGSLQATQSSSYSSSKFGQNTGIKGQSSQQTTNFGEKPLGSSQTTSFGSTQTGFGTTFGSQFGQKPLTSTGTTGSAVFEVQSTSQQEQKPFGSQSATGSLQATQSSSYSSSKFGQNTGIKGQTSQQSTNFGQKPLGSSQITSFGSTQTGFGTAFGSQFGQKPLTSTGTIGSAVSEVQSTSQQEQKPFGSQSATGSLQATQSSSYSSSKFGQNTGIKGQTSQESTNFGQKPVGSSQTTSFGATQTGFGTTFGSQFGQKPLTSTGTTGSAVSEVQSTSQQEQKPFGSQSATGSLQATQSSSYSSSKLGQNTGIKGQTSQQSTNFGQKPLGSSQTTSFGSTQTGFETTFGSQFGQKPLTSTGTTGSAVSEVQSTSQQEQKPIGSQSATGSLQATQSSSYTSSKFGQNTGIKGQSSQQTTNFGQKPLGSSQTTSFGSTQTGFGTTFGSQFGQKPLTSSGDTGGIVSEGQSTSQQEQKPFGSQSSTGSLQAIQSSSYTSSKFGQNTGIKGQTSQQSTNFGQKPLGSSQTTSLGSTQTGFGTAFGSQFGQKPLTSTGTIGSAVSEVQSTSQQEQKPFGSQSATGSLQATQSSSYSSSKFGQNTGIKGQSSQQTTNFGQKPVGSSPTTSFGSTQTGFGTTFGSQFGQKPLTSTGTTGSAVSEVQSTSQQEQKPFGSQSATGSLQATQSSSYSSSKFGQNTGIKGQSSQQTTNFGQKPLGSSQTTSFGSTQTGFGSTFGSQFGQKPLTSTGTTGSSVSEVQSTSQQEQKPFGSQSATGSLQATQSSSYSSSKFGQNTGIKGQSSQQTTNFGQKPVGSSQTTSFGSTQTGFGTTFGSQFGQKPLTSTGTTGSAVSEVQSTSQQEQKPFGSQSATGSLQATQSSSYSSSKFGQNTGIKGQSSQQTTNFGQKPLGSSQSTSFGSTQTGFGSTFGSQFGQKPFTSTGTTGSAVSEVQSTSQQEQKPFGSQSATGSLQATQSSSYSSSKFGQNTGIKGQTSQQSTNFGQKPVGSSQTTSFGSTQTGFETTFGSQFGQKPLTSTGTTGSAVSEVQTTSQQEQKPIGSQSATGSLQATQSSSYTSSKFGQNTGIKGQTSQQSTNFGQKPVGSSQTTSFGSTQTGFGTTFGSQFGQKPLTSTGTTGSAVSEVQSTSQQEQKPFGSQSATGSLQATQSSSYTSSKFGQNTGIKGQSSQQTTNFGQKPLGSSQTTSFGSTQTGFGTTFGSQFGQKPLTSSGDTGGIVSEGQSTSQQEQKPFGSQSSTGSLQATQSSSYTSSKFGQNTGIKGQTSQQSTNFGQKPLGSSQITSFGSTQTGFGTAFGSQFGQKPLTSTGTIGSAVSEVQSTSQQEQKPFGSQSATGSLQATQSSSYSSSKFGQNTGIKGQSSQQTTNFGQKPVGSSQTTSFGSTQTGFGTTFGSQFGQKPLTSTGTTGSAVSEVQSTSQKEQKPFGSQSATGSLQATQSSSYSSSKFGQNTGIKGQSSQQTINFGQKPLGSSQTTSFGSTQTGFGSTFGSQFGQKPLTSTGTTGSSVSEVQSTSQQEQKPFGSQSATGSLQATQSSSYTSSKFGQNTGIKGQTSQESTNFGQKPVGSSQTTSFGSTQTGFGTTFGSQFGQKPLTSTGTTGNAVSEVQSTSQQEQKPFGSQSATGSLQATQSSSYSSSTFGQNTGIKGQSSQQTTNFGQKPLGSSQTTSFGSTQTGFGTMFGSQFGQKPLTSLGDTDGTVSEGQSTSQQEQKPFGSPSSTGSLQVTQSSSYTPSKFGQNTGIKGQTSQQSTNFGQKPVGSLQTTSFGSTQTGFGTTFGSQFGQKPLTSTGTTGSAVSEVQSTSQQEQKPIGSQSATGSLQATQSSSYTSSKFGQNTGIKGQSSQQTTNFGQKPVGSSQTTSFGSTQTGFGTTFGSQFGQKPLTSTGTTGSAISEIQSTSQQEQKPFGSQSTVGSFQATQLGSYILSKFDQNTGIKGQIPKSTTTTFTSNLGSFDGTQTDRVSRYQFMKFGSGGTQTYEPFSSSLSTPTDTGLSIQKPSFELRDEGFKALNTFPSLSGFEKSQSSVGSTRFGTQQSLPTIQFSDKSQTTPSKQVSFKQVKSTISSSNVVVPNFSQHSSQNAESLFGHILKPNSYGSFKVGSVQDSSPFGSTVFTKKTSIVSINNNEQSGKSYVGNKEVFGNPRDPSKFDASTGYHY